MDMSSVPRRAKRLRVIDHMGTYYAYLGSDSVWKLEKWVQRLIMMCDGKKTVDQIALEIAKISDLPADDVRFGLKPILEDLQKSGMIEA